MLTFFETHNFKSIKSLSLELRPFMVLVGPNGAGKTNIVRSLELFGEIIRRGTTDPVREQGYDQLIRREKRPARSGLYFSTRVELPRDIVARSLRQVDRHTADPAIPKITLEASVTLSGSVSSEEVKVAEEQLTLRTPVSHFCIRWAGDNAEVTGTDDPQLVLLFARSLMGPLPPREVFSSTQKGIDFVKRGLVQAEDPERRSLRLLNWQRFSSVWMRYFRDAVAVTRLRLDSSALRRDSTFEESSRDHLIGPNGEGLAAAVSRLRGHAETPTPRFRAVLEALQRVYPRIEDVKSERIQPGRLVLLFHERGISEDLGQTNVSDGVLHALALLVALEGGLGGGGLLAIEEPENAIHPWSLRTMITRAQEHAARQIILTTHSETVVNEVKDTASLYVIENGDEGTTATPALKKEAALNSILKESGQKLGTVWLDGTLGGVPEQAG